MSNGSEALIVSYVIITRNRKSDLSKCLKSIQDQGYVSLEIVVVDNNSADGTEELFEDEFNTSKINYIRLPKNLGVCGGRNVGINNANGDIIVTLDDDATLVDVDSTDKIVGKFIVEPDIGVLAFKIVDADTCKVPRNYFPTFDKKTDPDLEFETTWFIGAGHAIKREVYEEVGLYRDYFPYGHEDFDLALRILDSGRRILYFPQVEIYHREAPEGRISDTTKVVALNLKHRIKAAILNLPWYSIISFWFVWTTYWLWKSRGNPNAVILGHYWLFRDFPRMIQERRPIRSETVRKLWTHKGRLFY